MTAGCPRPGLGDREGPLSEWQTAAQRYRIELGWPVYTYDRFVWLLTDEIEALDVPAPLGAGTLTLLWDTGIEPTVFRVPDPHDARHVFLIHRAGLAGLDYRLRLAELGVLHLWAHTTLDLPPSQFHDYRLAWLAGPAVPLPDFTSVAQAIIRSAATEAP